MRLIPQILRSAQNPSDLLAFFCWIQKQNKNKLMKNTCRNKIFFTFAVQIKKITGTRYEKDVSTLKKEKEEQARFQGQDGRFERKKDPCSQKIKRKKEAQCF